MPKFKHKFGHTYYELLGKKGREQVPLVCLHGGPGGSHFYFRALHPLTKSRQVLMYDQIGSGRSSALEPKHQTVKTLVKDLDALLEKLNIKRFHLLGVSWGGTLAVEYYLHCNGRGIESLILQSPLISSRVWAQDAKRLLATLPKKEQKIIKTCLEIGATDAKVYAAAEKEYVSRYVFRGEKSSERKAYDKKHPNPHGRELYARMWGPSEFVATGVLKDHDLEPQLAKITAPTLFICGEYDEATPAAIHRFSRRTKSSRVEVVKGASHSIASEKPSALLSILKEHFENVRAMKSTQSFM